MGREAGSGKYIQREWVAGVYEANQRPRSDPVHTKSIALALNYHSTHLEADITLADIMLQAGRGPSELKSTRWRYMYEQSAH